MKRYVAYFRVSTARQGKSGLGLAAQKSLVEKFVSDQFGDAEIVSEFVEVQSGKNDQRIELWKAISHAKKVNAKILIAKLDRFSRKVSFIAGIMEQGIGLVVAEMPNASDFQLHIFAALAQEERRMISERTRNALREAKSRGVELGKHGKILALKNRDAADQRANDLGPIIIPMISESLSYGEITRRLNEKGLKSATGGKFHPQTVKNLVLRITTKTNF